MKHFAGCIAVNPGNRTVRRLNLLASESDVSYFREASIADIIEAVQDKQYEFPPVPSILFRNLCMWLSARPDGSVPQGLPDTLLSIAHGNAALVCSSAPEVQVAPYSIRFPCGHAVTLTARAAVLPISEPVFALMQVGLFPAEMGLVQAIGLIADRDDGDCGFLSSTQRMVDFDQSGNSEMLLLQAAQHMPIEWNLLHGHQPNEEEAASMVDKFFSKERG